MGERFLVLIYLITALMVRIVYSTLRKTLPETASQKAPRNAVCLLVLRRMPPITLSRLVREPQRAERPTDCIVTEAAAQVQATDETTRQARHRVCTVCVSATHTQIALCCTGSLSLCVSNSRTVSLLVLYPRHNE